MCDFLIRTPEPLNIAEFFASAAPSFLTSPEFVRLDSESRRIPGVAVGAFKSYLIRLQQEELNRRESQKSSAELDLAYDAVESLASRLNPEIDNLLVVEVFEHLWCDSDVLSAIKSRLKPKSLALYNRWIDDDR